ncbi:glycosyltransferase [Galbibacter sp. BG1]|uniref:glycosyltransferase family 2 protein n=1 Tax=Galbibacter sp. BG1 TaxID=1170699 RepID=UPI0015BAB7A7|nr:glycosyltransferase [Galbibacter sp. BG1]QLE02801.1 glycosyltransferase [Galbibacter sp. BG1]
MKLTIVIPVYNVEKYIERCIKSALDQGLSEDIYEILIIDDESPDNSMKIVHKIAENSPALRVISQKNKGLGGARNTGIKNAFGDYILFLDSDDYLNPNVLNNLLKIGLENQLDILDFGARGVNEKGETVYTVEHLLRSKVSDGPNYFKDGFHQSACVRLYKRDFLLENKLIFREKVYVEDVEFNFKAVFLAKRIIATNMIISNFVQTTGSITRSSNSEKNKKLILDILDAIKRIDRFSKEVITKKSVAYGKAREKVNEQTITLLKILFLKSKDLSLFNQVVGELKCMNLYPSKFRSKNRKRQLFKVFSNNGWFYSQCYKLKRAVT